MPLFSKDDGNTNSHQPKTDLTFLETGPACSHLLISRQICVATQLQSIFSLAQNLGFFKETILRLQYIESSNFKKLPPYLTSTSQLSRPATTFFYLAYFLFIETITYTNFVSPSNFGE